MVDSIEIAQLGISQAPVLSSPNQNIPPAALPNPAPQQSGVTDQVDISSAAAQQSGASQPKVEYANPEVLGTEAVTMYMVNGQLYTRYRNEITNKVTYIPNEAQVLPGNNSGSGNAAAQPALDITA